MATTAQRVLYPLPSQRAREFQPQVLNRNTIKVYAASPLFWAVSQMGSGKYKVQMASVLGVGHAGDVVTAVAAAEFLRHTRHIETLLGQMQTLGWDDLHHELSRIAGSKPG